MSKIGREIAVPLTIALLAAASVGLYLQTVRDSESAAQRFPSAYPFQKTLPADDPLVKSVRVIGVSPMIPNPFGIVIWKDATDFPSLVLQRTGSAGQRASIIWHNILSGRCVRPDGSRRLVVDLGGNVGFFSLLAASYGCRVITVEAMQTTAELFWRSVRLNGFEDRITLVRKAISDSPTPTLIKMVRGDHSGVNHIGDGADDCQSENDPDCAATIRVDDLPINEDVLLMKIDVEGAEILALGGAQETFRTRRIENMLIEIKPIPGAARWIDTRLNKGCTIRMFEEIWNRPLATLRLADVGLTRLTGGYPWSHHIVAPVPYRGYEDIWLTDCDFTDTN